MKEVLLPPGIEIEGHGGGGVFSPPCVEIEGYGSGARVLAPPGVEIGEWRWRKGLPSF